MALHFPAGRLEYRSGSNRADASVGAAGLCLRRADDSGSTAAAITATAILSRQDHYHSLLVPRDILSECFAFCLSIFPLFANPLSRPERGSITSSSDRPCRGCGGTKVARSNICGP